MREYKNVSLRELARRLGFSAAYLSDVELGRRGCSNALLANYKLLAKERRR